MTQQEFVLSKLESAYISENRTPYLPFNQQRPEPAPVPSIPFTFSDNFAGIGGFRIALEARGGTCVFSCESDKYAQKTYKAWFDEMPYGDIRNIEPIEIPDHDILAAGFPCQPFSIAGVSKKKSLGRAHGFSCETQGTLFFYLATIIEIKRPPILFLENVKNLQSHDGGRTWAVIRKTLEDLNYWVFHKVIDASGWVPQHRERVYIVCFDKHVFPTEPAFFFPEPPKECQLRIRDILEKEPDPKYTLTNHLWNYLQRYAERHREKGNGFGYGLVNLDGISRTLSARYYKDGSEILIPQGSRNPRRLTPLECAKLMGFDLIDSRQIVVSDTQAYRQFGNAVVPKVVEAILTNIINIIAARLVDKGNGCLLKKAATPAA